METTEENRSLQNRLGELERQLADAQAAIRELTSPAGDDPLRRYELFFTHSRDIILFIRRDDGRILDANAAAVQAYGYSRAQLLALTIQDLRAPATQAQAADQLSQADSQGIRFETAHRCQDGSTFPVEVSSQGATIDGERILISVIRDITERIQGEAERVRLMAELQQEKFEIQKRVEELNAIIEAMRDPVIVYDQTGVIYQANASAVRAHGFDPSHLHRDETNRSLVVHHPDGRIAHSDDLPSAHALLGETVIGQPLELTNAKGQELTVLITSTPLIVNGVQSGAVSVWHDITEQKQAEQALQKALTEAEEGRLLLEALMAFVPEGIAITGGPPDFPIKRVSRYGLELTGNLSQSDLVGVPVGKHQFPLGILMPDGETHPSAHEMPLYRASYYGESIKNQEMVIRTHEGVRIPVLINAAPIRDAQGQIVAAINSWRDFADRKRLEEALREARDRAAWLARLPGENPNPIARVSAEGVVLYRNRPAAETPGWTFAADQPLPEPFLPLVARAIARGQELHQRIQLDERIYSVTIMPFPDEGYANLYGRDITDRNKAEEALAESKRRINDILMSLGDGLFALDREWKIIYINEHAAQIAEQPSDDLVGKNIWELWPELPGTPVEKYYRRVMEEGIPEQFRALGIRTGRWYDVNVYPSSEGITIFYVDRTEQTQIEQALLKSEEHFRQLANSMPQLVWTARPDGSVDYYNQRHKEYHGLVMNDDTWEWTPGLHPEDVASTLEAWHHSLETGELYQSESRVLMADGSYRWHLSRGMAVRDEEGRIIRWFGTATDIQDQKMAEEQLRLYTEKLKISNRELQEFAYVASHDLQEPLRKIQAFGDSLLESATPLDDHQRDYLGRMRTAAARMRAMVDSLLLLSRITTQGRPFVRVDLAQVADDVLSDLEYQINRTGGKVLVGNLPVLEGDPLQLHQLLQNLIGNALKYHHPDTPPVIKVSANLLPSHVQILVEDNGIGFNPDEIGRMFQPFQRLVGRSQFEGSGIGLAICRRIVERHSGEITAKSEPGKGSVFIVTLPVSVKWTEEDGMEGRK